MNLRAACWTTFLLVTVATAQGAEIDFVEDFALSADRGEALKLLIPGSEDYYYYHCLHYQNTEQYDQVDQFVRQWIARYKDTPRLREIQNRQALLTYSLRPQESLEYLRQRLGLQFAHQREVLGEKPRLLTQLDQALIRREALSRRAMQRHSNLAGFEDAALDWLVEQDLDRDRRRHLLERLARPDYPRLPGLIAADLQEPASKPFGSLAIHQRLLLRQLDELLRIKPDLVNETAFVHAYLRKLRPNDDVDWQANPDERQAYLERLWGFAQKLAPVHNSLKAHILYHRLVLDRSRGVYDQQRFMTYLQLPRNVGYIEPKFLEREENRRYAADLNQDFQPLTLFPAVRDDEPLVRSYLQHFFLAETSTQPYGPYIRDTYLREQFAETKIVNGLGEPEKWYSLLPPERYQALRERVDLDFAFTNKDRFSAREPVQLDLFVKNVRTLIVKVFEVNTRNYYREQQREVNTDINLDGLVANDEQTYQYEDPPLRRVPRHFEFPSLDRPGVYVIDFIGSGVSSRAVIRKGRLRYLARTSTAGHVFTVLDDDNQPVRDATLWLAGHEYQPDKSGQIVVPFSTQPGRQSILLSRGSFSSWDEFDHAAESYQLAAGMYVDRESLLAGKNAKLVVRPALYLNGTPVTLSVLEDVRLVITSTDRDGVSTSKEVKDFALLEDRESVYEFQTPPRLASIQFALRAKVHSLTRNEKLDLSAAESFSLNDIDKSDKIEDLHLARMGEAYVLELRGKTGEPKPHRPVQLKVKHRDFCETVDVTLQTDAAGRVLLGPLADIAWVTATGPEGTSHTWTLLQDLHAYPQSLHGVAGEAVEVPYMGQSREPQRAEISLLELRGDTFVEDRFPAVSIRGGMLQIRDLPRGDYDLWLKRSGQRLRIRLAAGPRAEGYVLGDRRHLELRGQRLLQIASVAVQPESIVIQLQNASKYARVHVFATRYQPAYSAFGHLGRIADPEPYAALIAQPTTLYVTGRNIGDEYRYIIDRKYARKLPGNMLERPSLLLNPWALRSTETGEQQAAAGAEFKKQAEARPAPPSRAEAQAQEPPRPGEFANLDFLADASAVLLNLAADEKGTLTVPRAQLGAHPQLHILAVDPQTTAYRTVALPETPARVADLRLADGLDPKGHFTQQKRITIVPAKGTFVLPDITTSKFETYDSLARVYSVFATLSQDSHLAEFGFVRNWARLPAKEKQENYSKYACHELNFFLYKKDRAFFAQVVQPYLANKRDKTFLDHWLLGAPLEPYLAPWKYAQLNVVERILLSQRLAQDRPHTVRHVNDLWELLPPDIDRFNFLFLTAVQGSALETSDRLGLGEARRGAMARKRAPDAAALQAGRMFGFGAAAGQPAPGAARAPAQPAEEAEPAAEAPRAAAADRPALTQRTKAAREAAGATVDSLERLEMAVRGEKEAAGKYFADERRLREQVRQLYRRLDKTQEWAENNYYQRPIEQQNADLVTVNAFWRDYAGHDPQQPFLSTHLAEASRNFTEMMFALAVLDLPFEPGQHETRFQGTEMTLAAASPMVVFHEEIRRAEPRAGATPILVSQNFFRLSDRYYYENGQKRDKFVTDEFLVHTVYGCQVVVTNPTSTPQKLDVLLQIPHGAVPVANAQPTRSVSIDLQPYNTKTIEYHFYFPAAGQFAHYPVHVANNEQLLAFAQPVTLKVVEEPSRVDRTSWDYISQNGSSEEVLQYLRENNLSRINLERIAFRMSDEPFFRSAIDLLARRHAYNDTLWSYGIKHNCVPAIREYLQHADAFVAQCGPHMESPLLSVDPVARKAYQHLEYRPLVNPRVHPLGKRRQILNARLHAQYHQLLKILACRRQLDHDDLMSVTYYLLLQDRIEEAMGFFGRVDAAQLKTRLQHDYFTAYLAMSREDLETARKVADRYRDYPVDRWRNAFAAIDQQLKELAGAKAEVLDRQSRDQIQTQLAATEPTFDFQIEAKKVRVNYQNLARIGVNYYLMDIELLFSRNPFVQQYASQFSHIRPNLTATIDLPARQTSFEFPLPGKLHNRNVLVEITGGGQTKSQAYYSNALALQVIENYGQIRVTGKADGRPLGKVYVKVYARMKDGTVRFYKDGYTDLRGRFDYASLNTNDIEQVEKFALLVLSDEFGAAVREASPPKS